MASKTILVTGAGGYIGSTLVPRLLESGKRVIAVDRYFFGSDKLADHPNLTKLRTDVRLLEPSAFRSVDAVIDLAALSNDPLGDLFTDETWEINHQARARNARLAKAAGVKRYVMPSSCSIYGFFPPSQILDEDCTPNPLTVYAKANLAAEQDIRPLADDDFTVGVVRFSTLFGISPRMRFDLAVNGMTETAWRTGKLALMRDGTQWRPMIHVRDAARALEFMLEADAAAINGRVFNAGSNDLNVQIRALADRVKELVPRDVEIDWYGDPDTRSYRVSFDRIAALGYHTTMTIEDGVREIVDALQANTHSRSLDTLTLDWYRALEEWRSRIEDVVIEGKIIKRVGGLPCAASS
ncbi:NAD-dependent epimerase/dehydratase family protein [Hyphomicrobium sulfonivorans]|nr:SDR family oxidoreductase [Hyphomicrobium sulfonivorans]MBI1648383.1 SDR family oxidoreductase [Hyphomicrobium sulfonivorans]NSL71081.1 NAD-dependent dehydratase [Hyphomicrobium sulfonivorans]